MNITDKLLRTRAFERIVSEEEAAELVRTDSQRARLGQDLARATRDDETAAAAAAKRAAASARRFNEARDAFRAAEHAHAADKGALRIQHLKRDHTRAVLERELALIAPHSIADFVAELLDISARVSRYSPQVTAETMSLGDMRVRRTWDKAAVVAVLARIRSAADDARALALLPLTASEISRRIERLRAEVASLTGEAPPATSCAAAELAP